MVIVDSSVWIESMRREGRIDIKIGLEGLVEAAEAAFCGPIKLEVLGGARIQDRKRLSAYFECIPYRPINDAAWEFAKDCAWRLRDKGHTIPWNDILIGSLSVTWNCRVYSADQHFETMRDVIGVRLYKPGYGGKYEPDLGG
jgi:predicted nucleic acid-binding protein